MKRRRKPLSKAELLARMPGVPVRHLTAAQIRDIGISHINALDLIANGQASEQILWDYISNVLTWLKTAELLDLVVDEMREQFEVACRLMERFRLTGRVLFTGPDYQTAKLGRELMDALAEAVDKPTALQAARWSEATLPPLIEPCKAYRKRLAAMQGAA